MREYTKKVEREFESDIIPVQDFLNLSQKGVYTDSDGRGYWAKNGFRSNDDVFYTAPLDATHVIWYGK